MKVSKELKDFLEENKNLINSYNFEDLYKKADKLTGEDYSKLSYIFNNIGIDPLEYMKNVPKYYMIWDNNLKVVKIPDGILIINKEAFSHCYHLETVYLPKTLKKVETSAFSCCDSLKDIYYDGTVKEWEDDVDIEINGNVPVFKATIHCKNGKINGD